LFRSSSEPCSHANSFLCSTQVLSQIGDPSLMTHSYSRPFHRAHRKLNNLNICPRLVIRYLLLYLVFPCIVQVTVPYLSLLSALGLYFPVSSLHLILTVLYPLLCLFCVVMCFMILYDALCSEYTRLDIYESQLSTTVDTIRRPMQHITSKVDPSRCGSY
jgi:hypothetical protein